MTLWSPSLFNDPSKNPSFKPFGNKRIVALSFGGAATVIERRFLNNQSFLNGASFTNAPNMKLLTAIDQGAQSSSGF